MDVILTAKRPTDAEVATHRIMMNSTYGSSGIEPAFKQAYERTIRKPIKMARNKEWHPTCGARVGDCTTSGQIIELKPETTRKRIGKGESIEVNTGKTIAVFDRETDRFNVYPFNSTILDGKILNWSRLARVIEQLIDQRKKRSTQPVFKSMLKNLALLWECKIEDAYKRSDNIEELEAALEKAKLKEKTVARQKTDIKFGI